MMIKKNNKSGLNKIIAAFLFIVLVSVVGMGNNLYQKIYTANILAIADKQYLYVPTKSTFDQLLINIKEKKLLINTETFKWVATQMGLPTHMIPGRYEVKPGMSNYDLVKLLRSGKQSPLKIVINKFRLKIEFTEYISSKLEIDKKVLEETMDDEMLLAQYGFTPHNIMCCFIPNTYEFYWNTSTLQFITRMKKEYDLFWNESRKAQAAKAGISINDACVLASIIEEETNRDDEKPLIASVYLNRLKKNMLLQADPTIKFAVGDFSIRRVTGIYIEEVNNSPYNTYRKQGLPPGPICTPSLASIDAVLKAEPTDYLYFCASVSKPNYHQFASSYNEHKKNARRYHQYLNKRGIQ